MYELSADTNVEEIAGLAADALSRLHTFALRSYIAEHSSALNFLYGAVPMPNSEELTGDVNFLTLEFQNFGPLSLFWNDLATAEAMAGVTDAMQICGKPGRAVIARRRQAYVMTAQTFWLSYWNTYKVA